MLGLFLLGGYSGATFKPSFSLEDTSVQAGAALNNMLGSENSSEQSEQFLGDFPATMFMPTTTSTSTPAVSSDFIAIFP